MAKLKLTVTLAPDLIRWIDVEVKQGHFADRSHAIQFSLMKTKELIDKGQIKF
ncbi:MAG: hypothetical protein NWE92_01710 [Candidatus Bathyarchaeota archaeon]|nr:hypothetical protein [Candidatus Bathyarchaeota archaeon]